MSGPPTTATQVRRTLVWLAAAEVVALAATGAYLLFFYRPTSAQAWSEIYAAQRQVNVAVIVRSIHRWTSQLFVLTALVLAVTAVVEAVQRWSGPARRRVGAWSGPVVLVVAVLAAISGTLIAWDQLALWSVTVGSDVQGYRTVLDDDRVRFAIIGGTEVSLGALRTWLLLHAVAIPALAVGLLWLLGRDRPAEAAPEG